MLMRFHPVSIPGNRSLALYLSETVLCKVENRWFSTPFCLLSLLRRCVQSTTRSTGNHDAEIVMLHIRGARTNLHFALYGGNCHKMRQARYGGKQNCALYASPKDASERGLDAFVLREVFFFYFSLNWSLSFVPWKPRNHAARYGERGSGTNRRKREHVCGCCEMGSIDTIRNSSNRLCQGAKPEQT